MKKAVLLLVFAALAMGAQAQLRFGVKAGVGINSLHFDGVASNFDSNNRTGFTGGLMLDLNLPHRHRQCGADAQHLHQNRIFFRKRVENNFFILF